MITCGQCNRFFYDKADFYSEEKHPSCFQGVFRAFGWIKSDTTETEAKLRIALRDAIEIIEGLEGQQAMPDYGYVASLERIKKILND